MSLTFYFKSNRCSRGSGWSLELQSMWEGVSPCPWGSEGCRPGLWPFCTLTVSPRASQGHWAISTLPHLPGKKAPEADS